ncbi:MAG TPA: hypothetical protein VMQ65_06840 [Candidatus Limnocylindria bacterium]|nr:hypothetical protein [Candidatus Limnocylindria bacterium]
MIKTARARHTGAGLRFTIRTGSGHELAVDDEAGNNGPRPAELLLAAQAGCSCGRVDADTGGRGGCGSRAGRR